MFTTVNHIRLAILVTGLFIFSCSPSNLENVNGFHLLEGEINFIGTQHNTFVEKGFESLDYIDTIAQSKILEIFLTFAPDFENKDLMRIIQLAEKRNFDVDLYSNEFQNPQTIEMYKELITLCNKIEHFTIYESKIMNLKKKVEQNLKGFDREFMLVSLTVALNSANLWLPIKKGGQGLYNRLHNEIYPSNSISNQLQTRDSEEECLADVLAGDVSGAAGVFFLDGDLHLLQFLEPIWQ